MLPPIKYTQKELSPKKRNKDRHAGVEEQNLKRGTGDLVIYEKPEQNDGKEKSGKNDRKGMYKKHWRYVRRRNKVKRKGRTRTETPNEGVGRLQSGGER